MNGIVTVREQVYFITEPVALLKIVHSQSHGLLV